MASSARYNFYAFPVIVALLVLLASCAPPPSVPQQSGNLSLEMRRLQAALDRQEQTIRDLSEQVVTLREQQQEQARSLDQLRQGTQTARSGYPSAGLPLPTDSGGSPMTGEGSPTEVYLQAFGDYASGRYQAALLGFESFLQRFPNNSYASNAQFWLADSYFNQQQYPVAIQQFERVLNDYQNAPKAPDALYKIAVAQLQLGASGEARQAIDLLNQRYPKSTATQKAQELVIP